MLAAIVRNLGHKWAYHALNAYSTMPIIGVIHHVPAVAGTPEIHPAREFSQSTLTQPQRRDYFSGVSFAPFSTFSLKLATTESTIN